MFEILLGTLVLAGAVIILTGAPIGPAGDLSLLLDVRGTALLVAIGLSVIAHGSYRLMLKKAPASRRHGLRTSWLMLLTLTTTILLGLGVPLFADVFNLAKLGGFPFGFYLSAQGALVALTILSFVFVRRQDKIDAEESAPES